MCGEKGRLTHLWRSNICKQLVVISLMNVRLFVLSDVPQTTTATTTQICSDIAPAGSERSGSNCEDRLVEGLIKIAGTTNT